MAESRSRISRQSMTCQLLRIFRIHESVVETYANHGEDDISCCRRVRRSFSFVDEAVGAGGGDDDADSEVANERDVVCVDSVGCDNDKDADNTGQHPDWSKPCVVWEYIVDIRQDLTN